MASDDIWILGIHMTKFGKRPDDDVIDLAAEASLGRAEGRRGDDGRHRRARRRQPHGGQRPDRPDVAEADRPDGHPRLQRVERLRHGRRPRCGRRSWPSRRARRDMGLAVGVEKLSGAGLLSGGSRKADADEWTPSGRYGAVAGVDGRIGTEIMPGVFAQVGMEYGHKYGGADFELFARISEKNHSHSTLNPLAAYTKKMTLEEIMGDVMIAYPNTRPMCSANCDGAAAAVVVSDAKLQTLDPDQQRRAVKVSASRPHVGPVGGGVPDPPRRQHPHPPGRHPGLRAGRRRPRGPRPGRAPRLLRHRRAGPLRQPHALQGG